MCGIFGIVLSEKTRGQLHPAALNAAIGRLYALSESRGREAAGIALKLSDTVHVYKQAGSPAEFVESPKYLSIIQTLSNAFLEPNFKGTAILGHSRLVTNGLQTRSENNQPVVVEGAVGIHNGIITNEAEILARHPEIKREYDVDTELFLKLLRANLLEHKDSVQALTKVYGEIEGSASVACFTEGTESLLVATNTGSLFYAPSDDGESAVVFASERYILKKFLEENTLKLWTANSTIKPLKAFSGIKVDIKSCRLDDFIFEKHQNSDPLKDFNPAHRSRVFDHSSTLHSIRRCTKCILPETHPMSHFDSNGVCAFCRNHRKIQVKGEELLRRMVEPYRSKDGSPDVIVAFSGGRDSAYGLHYVKKVLGMNPVAFTYDWGLVTDLARRNQSRICAKLGVEHIVRAADIPLKRRYVRKNVEAWLKKPELGMVTLFTAGDKEFYEHARKLRKETGIKLVIFCTGNMIEDTPYKTGFCGFQEADHGMTLTGLSVWDKIRLIGYYMKQYLRNPAYFNESIFDTLKAYWYTFVKKDDFLYLYHYVNWDERTIVDTIVKEYNWEVATDTSTTWRIGDGTAPFYNYIYTTMAGFSEDDVMLSNMVREGILTREEALIRGEEYRKPRYPSLKEYAQIVGFNLEEALNKINSAPKLYT